MQTSLPVVQDNPEEAAETCIEWLEMHGAVVLDTPGGSATANMPRSD